MRPLLRLKTNDGKLVDLAADFVLISLGVQGFQIFAHRVEQAEKQWLLLFDQVEFHFALSLHHLLLQMYW